MNRVAVFHAHPAYRRKAEETIRLVRRVLRGERRQHAEISIIFIGHRRMRALNSKFLQHHYTTDVLSFPLSDDRKTLSGEVYVNVEQAKRQAKTFGVSVREEIKRLIVHGVLHLVGYDDTTQAQKKRMAKLEDMYLGASA